ncbi:MAG: hypothetical protein ACYS6W_07450 [Planctomycetota bacterium]|jgi:hypothetical protein
MNSKSKSGWIRNKRLVFSVLLVPIALAVIIYGTIFHSTTILAKQSEEPEDHQVAEPASMKLQEPTIIRDTTVGGLVRLDSGAIRRTYSGKPPSSCPT